MHVFKLHVKLEGREGDYFAIGSSLTEAMLRTLQTIYDATGKVPDITF